MSTDALLAVLAIPHLVAGGYLATLAVCARRTPACPLGEPRLRLQVIIPAHDEEGGVAQTVGALATQTYPADLWRAVVIADNCSDWTAERARGAGAEVWERSDPHHRGKGYALAEAFARVRAEGWADAVVVLDADSRASSNLLHALADRLQRGARAVQAEYGVSNPEDSWRTRLMRLALALFHTTRSLARERLGLSSGLRGNGMGFELGLLSEVPYEAVSLVEDVEYGLRLGQAGVRVAYVPEASVRGEMPAGEEASRSQRRRWEHGRSLLVRRTGPRLLAQALRRRDPVLLDLALDLLVPPLTLLSATALLGLGAAAGMSFWWGGAPTALATWGGALLLLGVYVARGWQLSGTGLRGLADLAGAPAYALWRMTLRFRSVPGAKDEWVRTARRSEGSP